MIAIGRFILGNEALAVPIWWSYAAAEILITAGFFFGREALTESDDAADALRWLPTTNCRCSPVHQKNVLQQRISLHRA